MNMNMVQYDFILRMYAKDHPDELKVIDPEIKRGEAPPQIFASWSNKFSGETKKEFDRMPMFFLKKYYGWSKQ